MHNDNIEILSDEEIIELYWLRDELAISETKSTEDISTRWHLIFCAISRIARNVLTTPIWARGIPFPRTSRKFSNRS